MDKTKEEIQRLAKKLGLQARETSKDFYSVVKVHEDFTMGFHTYDEFLKYTGSGLEVRRRLAIEAGECSSFVDALGAMFNPAPKPLCTLAEAQWIADILQLPSARVDDVRRAITIVLESREK